MILDIDRWISTCALVVLVIFIGGCSNSLPEASIDKSLKVGDYAFVAQEITGTVDHCDPRTMSGYASAPPLARRIADGGAWDLEDGTAALALIDSFQHSAHHAFYSAVLLRTLPKADGYFAEPLGLVLFDDLLKRPCSLLACCWENGCDGHPGLLLWTRSIAGEILIEHEDDPWSAFKEYATRVEAQANADCDLQTRSRTNEFLYEIGRHVKRAIERDSLDALR